VRHNGWQVLKLGLNVKEAGGVVNTPHKQLGSCRFGTVARSFTLHRARGTYATLTTESRPYTRSRTGLLKRASTSRCIKRRDQQLCFTTEPKSGVRTRHHAGRHKRRTYSRHRCGARCAQSRASAKPSPHAYSERHTIIAGSRSRVRCSGIRHRRRHVRKCGPRNL
jgi:hypothetical protein